MRSAWKRSVEPAQSNATLLSLARSRLDAGRGSHADAGHGRREHDRERDPGVMDPASHQPRNSCRHRRRSVARTMSSPLGAAGHGTGSIPRPVRLLRLSGEKGVAIDLEQPGFAFAPGATERVDRGSYHDTFEPAFLKHLPPACARQATGNSIGPKVDVADRCFRHGLARRDIGELQASARLQHPRDLTKDAALVGAKVDDAVADDDICPAAGNGERLGVTFTERDVCAASFGCALPSLRQHGGRPTT